MKKIALLLISFFFIGISVFAQIGIGTTTPDPNAMLDIISSNKGIIIPRVDFNNLPASPPAGFLVYVTANGPDGNNAFYFNTGTIWRKMIIGVTAIPPLSATTGLLPQITIPQASATQDGYIKTSDWTTFNNKLDILGGTLQGKLSTVASTTTSAGFNIQPGVAPTSPINGDLWTTSSGVYARINGANTGPFGTGNGSVTSVGMSMPAQFTVTNSPVSSSGTLTATWTNQTANTIFAGPSSGGAVAPTFRTLLDADIPDNITASNYLPLAGGTLTGKVNTFASSTTTAGLNLPHGAAPTTPTNGDVWTTTTGLFARINGSSIGPFGTGNGSMTSITASAPLTGGTITTSGSIGIAQANTTTSGYLSNTDWNTFNGMLSKTGGTMTGKINTLASSTVTAGLNVAPGAAPTTPANGDIWTTATGVFAQINGTTLGPFGTGNGSVTSVGMSMPAQFTVTNSPVSSSGTLTATWTNQTANTIFAGPSSGGAVAPTFRTLLDADIPDNITASNYLPLAGGTLTGKVNTFASSTTTAGLNLPHGAAPTTPTNGDVWTTTTGLFARINGSSVGPFGSSASLWSLTGNAGTNPATNFLGTTDAQPLVIKTNNTETARVTSAGLLGIGTATPNSTLSVNGSLTLSYKTVAANYTATANDFTIASGSTITIALPQASTCTGRIYCIIETASNSITVDPYSTETVSVDGANVATIIVGNSGTYNDSQDQVILQSTGTGWITLSLH